MRFFTNHAVKVAVYPLLVTFAVVATQAVLHGSTPIVDAMNQMVLLKKNQGSEYC